jgi:hypothetical protein
VLEGPPRLVLGVPRQVDLPVLADHAPALVNEDRRVEAPGGSAAVHAQLGIAETEPDTESACLVEERARLRPRHLALEEGVHLALVFHPPAGKERGERELGKGHEIAAVRLGPVQESEQPLDHLRPGVGALYRPKLCRPHRDNPGNWLSPLITPSPFQGEGRGEGGELSTTPSTTPHPGPLP